MSAPYDLTTFGFPAAASAAAANAEYFAFTDVVIRPSVYLVERASGTTVAKWRDIRTALGILLTADGNPLVTDYETGTLLALDRTDRKARTVIARISAGPVGLTWAEPAAEQTAVYVAESLSGAITRIALTGAATRTTSRDGPEPARGDHAHG